MIVDANLFVLFSCFLIASQLQIYHHLTRLVLLLISDWFWQFQLILAGPLSEIKSLVQCTILLKACCNLNGPNNFKII